LNAVVVPVCVIVGKPKAVAARLAPAGATKAIASTKRIPYTIVFFIVLPSSIYTDSTDLH
jgi:hypothetical protein